MPNNALRVAIVLFMFFVVPLAVLAQDGASEEELAKQVVGRCRGMDHLEELLAEENGLQH